MSITADTAGASNNKQDNGILVIWNNCAAGYEKEYEAWYQFEHMPERLAIPGFRRGRRYERVHGGPADFFTYYTTTDPDVFFSRSYLECLNNPTPTTKRMMTEAFSDMSRTVCRVASTVGRARGSFAVASATTQRNDLPQLQSYTDQPQIARAEWWLSAGRSVTPSAEERLRGGDDSIEACVFIETLREEAALGIADALRVSSIHTGVYRLLCELSSESVR